VAAIEIPAIVKRGLGLDADRSWIVLSEWNEFTWPGPDLRPVASGNSPFDYGSFSRGFFARVRDEFVAAVGAGQAKRVARTE
jgi:hypothetical protein